MAARTFAPAKPRESFSPSTREERSDHRAQAPAEALGDRARDRRETVPAIGGHDFAKLNVAARERFPNGIGRPLPEAVKTKMETGFGADFSEVRIHLSDGPRRLGAQALTCGDRVLMAPRAYRPDTPAGQRMLAHELTHVLQQRSGKATATAGTGEAINEDPSLEAEADRLGRRAAAGGDATIASGRATPATAANAVVQPWRGRVNGRNVNTNAKDGAGKRVMSFSDRERLAAELEKAGQRNHARTVRGELSKPAKVDSSSKKKFSAKKFEEEMGNKRQTELEAIKNQRNVGGWGLALRTRWRNRSLEKHLVSSGRAMSADEIAHEEAGLGDAGRQARTKSGKAAVKAWRQRRQAITSGIGQHNKNVDKSAQNLSASQHRRLTADEEAYFKAMHIPNTDRKFGAKDTAPRLVRSQPGGPHAGRREQITGRILAGLERTVNAPDTMTAKARAAGDRERTRIRLEEQSRGSPLALAERGQRIVGAAAQARGKPAHSVSRHGAQTTLDEQAARVAAGYSADQKPAVMPAHSVPGPNGIQVPRYATVGPEAVGASSRFKSQFAHFGAVREAFAQAWGHDLKPALEPARHREDVQVRQQVAVPQVAHDADGNPRPYNQWGWQTHNQSQDHQLAPTDRLQVNLPEDPEGYGESVALRGGAHPPALGNRGAALPSADLQQRVNALQKKSKVKGATFFMDIDKAHGGFKVQTGYPQPAAPPGVFAQHKSRILTRRQTDQHANVTLTTAEREASTKLKRRK